MSVAQTFFWRDREVPFRRGESIAAALAAMEIHGFGADAAGAEARYFCGIGACQCCLVRVNGRATEACLQPAIEGLVVMRLEDGDV